MSSKRIKDPIYGYIDIKSEIVNDIIDTSAFQRLRDITQTSYIPLYPSALNNRFVHSIGVYYLGEKVAKVICEKNNSLEPHRESFELACLLHDVGHAPFSHTGEECFLKKEKYDDLHLMLIELTNDPTLGDEIRDKNYKAKPHELMSAIVSLKLFVEQIGKEYSSFFARCIIGYKYTEKYNSGKVYLNSFIELLNSELLDVDKMDYLIRDAYVAGFDTAKIDYERLLNSISISNNSIFYNKSALSVVENLVYAHDIERKWIQSHPVVLYESYLLGQIMKVICQKFFADEYIPCDALLESGFKLTNGAKVKLLSDSDIVYLMKQLDNCKEVDQFYNRSIRKHPIWKTEAEYKAIFSALHKENDAILDEIKELKTFSRTEGVPFVINLDLLKAIEQTIQDERNNNQGDSYSLKRIEALEKHKKFVSIFQDFHQKQGIPFDFIIIPSKQFNSSFGKSEFGDMMFNLPILNSPKKLSEISNVLKQDKSQEDSFYYIFYSRDEKKELSISSFIEKLILFGSEVFAGKTSSNLK